MNPLIELFKKISGEGKQGILRENFETQEAYESKMAEIHNAINAATEEVRAEFLYWFNQSQERNK